MRFKINRNVMVELLKSMYKVVPRESPIKELTCFLLEANEDDGYLYVSATNLEVSVQRKIKVQMESGGSVLIKAQLLYQMVHLLGGDDVEILSKTEGLATIISGNCTYTISTLKYRFREIWQISSVWHKCMQRQEQRFCLREYRTQ